MLTTQSISQVILPKSPKSSNLTQSLFTVHLLSHRWSSLITLVCCHPLFSVIFWDLWYVLFLAVAPSSLLNAHTTHRVDWSPRISVSVLQCSQVDRRILNIFCIDCSHTHPDQVTQVRQRSDIIIKPVDVANFIYWVTARLRKKNGLKLSRAVRTALL